MTTFCKVIQRIKGGGKGEGIWASPESRLGSEAPLTVGSP